MWEPSPLQASGARTHPPLNAKYYSTAKATQGSSRAIFGDTWRRFQQPEVERFQAVGSTMSTHQQLASRKFSSLIRGPEYPRPTRTRGLSKQPYLLTIDLL